MKCKADILNPNLRGGCNEPDTDDYVHSIKGFDPCHEMDMTQSFNLEYNVTCKDVDDNDKVVPGGHPEGLGYAYSNLVETDNSTIVPFNYSHVSKDIKLNGFETFDMDFVFDVRDFKYLSNIERFSKKITDPEIIIGKKNDTIEIDWPKIVSQDEQNIT